MTRPTIKSYQDAARFLGRSSSRQTGQRGTSVVRLSDDAIAIRYHQTNVVTYYSSQEHRRVATIDNGGWITPTTASRINEYAPEGYGVFMQYDENEKPEFMFLSLPEGGRAALTLPYSIARQHSRKVAQR